MNPRVPLLDLRAQHAPLRAELGRAMDRVVDSGQFILGPEVEALEREVAQRCGVRAGVGVSSGSDALLATLMALGVGPGAQVVTTALSFFASAGAIARLGAQPVFADVDLDFNLDAEDALKRVGPRTKAILPVDLFGRRAHVERLAAAGLPVIEDAAQAIGAPSLARGAAAATLSFFPSKNLGGLGDGGMVVTDDEVLADKLRLLRAHGSRPKYVHHVIGGNFRLDALQAAVLRVKLPHLDGWTEIRRRNAARYHAAMQHLPGLIVPEPDPGHVWHHYVVRVESGRRDELRGFLTGQGIESEVYYPLALHLLPCFIHLGGKPGDLPGAEAASREALAIPVHPTLSDEQLDHVIAAMCAFFA